MAKSFCFIEDTDKMIGYRIRLCPTKSQKDRLNEMANLYKDVYNWTLETEFYNYKENKTTLRPIDLFKIYSKYRDTSGNEKFKRLPTMCARNAIRAAFKSLEFWWNGINKKPEFKNKSFEWSFQVRNDEDKFYFNDDQHVKIEGFSRYEFIKCEKIQY